MKRLSIAVLMGVGLTVGACSHDGAGSLTAPTPAFVNVPASGRVTTKEVKGSISANLVFAPDQLGKVTITNTSGEAHRFAFYVWDASDEVNQTMQARIEQLVGPGQTATLTVSFAQVCGTKYQRDVYVDVLNYEGATSLAEVQNYFFGAPGVFWQSEAGTCNTTPTPPPPPVEEPRCENQDANNYGGLLPCTFGEGGEQPPVDLCPNVEGIQLTLPCEVAPPPPQNLAFCHVEYHLKGGHGPHANDVVFVGENNLNIPLVAIISGHSDPAHHHFDHFGACTGEFAPIHGQD